MENNQNEGRPLSRKELVKKIKRQLNISKLAIVGFIPMFFLFVIFFTKSSSVFGFLFGSIIAFIAYNVVFSLIWRKIFHTNNMDFGPEMYYSDIFHTALSEKFQNLQTLPDEGIPIETLKPSKFKAIEQYPDYDGRNYTTCNAEGIPVEACQAAFGEFITTYVSGSSGSTRQELQEKVGGIFYVCHIRDSFTPLAIHSRRVKAPEKGEEKEEPTFENSFIVRYYSDDIPVPLPEDLKHALLETFQEIQCPIYLSFAENGCLYVIFQQKIFTNKGKSKKDPFWAMDQQLNLMTELLRIAPEMP